MKPTEYAERALDAFLKMPRRIQLIVFDDLTNSNFPAIVLEKYKSVDFTCTENCESPIEQMMMFAFEIITAMKNPEYVCLEPQMPLTLENGKTYRPDFTVCNGNVGGILPILIECDGHDFHEKTKAQVKRDNERDFDLKMAGYEVLHFSGSQIYNNPIKCAYDVFKFATEYSKKHGLNNYE